MLKKDDAAAFTIIYNRYFNVIYVHAYSRLQDKDEAQDVIHELFAHLWNKRSTLEIKSTDAVKDKEKWLKMIADENLGGTQLFAGGPGNEFSKYYKINTIPRFLLFDKAGKIVNVAAPRPSSPALKELIEKTLMAK